MARQYQTKTVFWALVALYFLLFVLLNFLTPLVSDDYRYAFSFATGERITSVWQIFPSLYEHYFVMHGRTAVHFFTQLFMLTGKPVFNVLNAAVAVGLLLGLHRFAAGRGQYNPIVLLGLMALSFLFIPAFGQTMLWLDGACNYLWGLAIIVWVLMPFRDAFLDNKNIRSRFMLMLFLGGSLLMGATSENSAPAAILVMAACTLYLWKKTGRLSRQLAASTALAGAGFLVLVLSPANAIRSAHYATEGVSRMGQLLLNFQTAAQMLLTHGLPLLAIFVVLYCVAAAWKADPHRRLFALALFGAGLAANFAMILSNGYPLRAMMGYSVFLLAGIAVVLEDALLGNFRPFITGALAVAVGTALITAMAILPQNYNRYAEARAREAYVIAQRDAGSRTVTTYTLAGKTSYDVFDDITDISFDETYWPNVYYAEYYGLDSVVTDTIR